MYPPSVASAEYNTVHPQSFKEQHPLSCSYTNSISVTTSLHNKSCKQQTEAGATKMITILIISSQLDFITVTFMVLYRIKIRVQVFIGVEEGLVLIY